MTHFENLRTSRQRNVWRSIAALFAGFVVVIVFSLSIDQLMHTFGVFPPWDEPMDQAGDNLLAIFYRCIIGILGSYVTARLAPHSPMLHVWIGGIIGFMLSIGGIVAATQVNLGPLWYPISLTLTALPCALLGGQLYIWTHSSNVRGDLQCFRSSGDSH